MEFVSNFRINKIPALVVKLMAWHRPGDKPLSKPMMVSLRTHICVTRPQCVKTTQSVKAHRWLCKCIKIGLTRVTISNTFHIINMIIIKVFGIKRPTTPGVFLFNNNDEGFVWKSQTDKCTTTHCRMRERKLDYIFLKIQCWCMKDCDTRPGILFVNTA